MRRSSVRGRSAGALLEAMERGGYFAWVHCGRLVIEPPHGVVPPSREEMDAVSGREEEILAQVLARDADWARLEEQIDRVAARFGTAPGKVVITKALARINPSAAWAAFSLTLIGQGMPLQLPAADRAELLTPISRKARDDQNHA